MKYNLNIEIYSHGRMEIRREILTDFFFGCVASLEMLLYTTNGYRIYVDIMTRENCRQFRLLTWNSFIGQFVPTVGGWLARSKFHFIIENENLV